MIRRPPVFFAAWDSTAYKLACAAQALVVTGNLEFPFSPAGIDHALGRVSGYSDTQQSYLRWLLDSGAQAVFYQRYGFAESDSPEVQDQLLIDGYGFSPEVAAMCTERNYPTISATIRTLVTLQHRYPSALSHSSAFNDGTMFDLLSDGWLIICDYKIPDFWMSPVLLIPYPEGIVIYDPTDGRSLPLKSQAASLAYKAGFEAYKL